MSPPDQFEGISLLILNWKRPENVTRILDAECKYPLISEVLVFNNNPEVQFQHKNPKVRVLNSSSDFGLRTRWVLGFLAKNECLVFQDDDILLSEEVFDAFAKELFKDPERAYSLHGRRLGKEKQYNFENASGEVEIVLTRAACVHKSAIPLLVRADYEFFKETGAYPTASEFPGDDVFLSFCLLSNYGKRHRVLTLPHQDLPAPHALSASKNYLRTRNAIVKKCRKFFFGPELGKLADIEAIPFSENDSTTAPSERVAQSLGTPLVPGMTTHTGTPRRLILVSKLSPGDILMLTAAVRDLHLSHPGKFITDVETSVPQLWENNPNITKLSKEDHGVEVVEAHYPLIHQCNEGPYHFIHGYRLDLEQRLGVKITPTKFWADVHFSKEELTWMSMIHQHFTEWDSPFWIICVGGKKDYTAKWWIQEYAQEVVDYFRDRIQFVQIGAEGDNHFHPPLKGVINLIGRTDLRQLMRLVYHASGVICPVTFVMHLAAAVPPKPGLPRRKPCVVTAGGREPSVWEAYTNHIFLHANGQMRCCENGGCWKSRILPLDDGDEKDRNVCLNPVEFNGRKVQACMRDLVKPADVIRAVEKYYAGGILQSPPPGFKTIDATWEDRISK